MKFKVGDLAITQNSSVPDWNNGLLVVVVRVTPGAQSGVGPVDYEIRRVDGRQFGWTTGFDGTHKFFKLTTCWCAERQLKKPDESDLREESEIQRLYPDEFEIAAFNAYEAAIKQYSNVDQSSTSGRVLSNEPHK